MNGKRKRGKGGKKRSENKRQKSTNRKRFIRRDVDMKAEKHVPRSRDTQAETHN